MNKHYLQSKIKSSGHAYALWFFLFAHFAYLGKWGLQILFWITVGGFGIWWIIEAFMIPGRVDKYNLKISQQIETIEKKEKEEEHTRNLAMITAARGVQEKVQ